MSEINWGRGAEARTLCVVWLNVRGHKSDRATPANIIECLRANPEACAEVMRGLDVPKHVEAIATERDTERAAREKAEADHLESQRNGARAAIERDEWKAKWEKLEIHRASCCDRMERERDEARERAPRTQRDPFEHRCAGLTRADVEALILAERERVIAACVRVGTLDRLAAELRKGT